MNETMKFHEKYIKREFCGDVKNSRASPELLAELDAKLGPRGSRNDRAALKRYKEAVRRESAIGNLNYKSMMGGKHAKINKR